MSKDYDAIYKGKGTSLILVKIKNGTLAEYIQLTPSEEGDFYTVNSGLKLRWDYLKNKELLWCKPNSSLSATSETAQSFQNKSPDAILGNVDTLNLEGNLQNVNNDTENILFQTQKELYEDARKFDTWVEFMDYYQLDFDPVRLEDPEYLSQVPSGADAQWYQTTWELARGVQPEESLNEKEVKERFDKEDTTPRAMESLFIAQMGEDNGMFEDFMHMVAYYEKLDLNSEEWQQVNNAEDAQERERIDHLKDLIEVTMKSESMQRAINRIAAGGEITPDFKRRLISEMSDGFKSRDFRFLYAQIMDDKSYKVNPEDTTETLLNNKINEINRRYNLQIPESDISRMSHQQRKELSDQLDNEEIATKLKDGSLKMDDQMDKYIKSLKSQISNLKKEQNELKKSILEETSRLADEEQKDLLKINEELIKAKIAYDKKNDEITRNSLFIFVLKPCSFSSIN